MATDNNNFKEFLDRWTDKIYPSKEAFLNVLQTKRLTIYHGVDPTAPHLHLGHSTNYLLLRELQKLGHKIILLIGDFTAQIGDPTGKDTTRRALTRKEVLENCKTYQEQAGKILDFTSKENPAELKFNSQWLSKLTAEEIVKLAANFTHEQMIQRDMFQKRLEEHKAIYLHEFLYPLFQAYDSVAMNVDVEIGGTDQTFNMLRGRDLMKIYKNKEKFVITTPLLINPQTGKKLMSKSEGNYIALNEPPNEMYGKTMALPDEVIISCFQFCTKVPLVEIEKMEKDLGEARVNPRDLKNRLAKEIVKIYHGKSAAEKAEKEFNKIFKEKKLPSKMPLFIAPKKTYPVLELLVQLNLARSKSEARRLIEEGGVRIIQQTTDNQKLTTKTCPERGRTVKNWETEIEIQDEMIIQVGKRKFIKVVKP